MTSLTLEHRRALDRCNEDLVVAAERLLDDAKVIEISRNDFGDSQMRNLLAVASETESPAVVLNFIRYQMGRDPKGRSWRRGLESSTLGDRLITDLDSGAVAAAVDSVIGPNGNAMLRQLAKIILIRQYLGFLSRYLKYLEVKRGGRT